MNHQEQIQSHWKLTITAAIAILVTIGALMSGSSSIIATASILSILAVTLVGLLTTLNVAKKLGGSPEYAVHVTQSIANGKLDEAINVKNGDSRSLIFNLRKLSDNLKENNRKAEEEAETNQRIIAALKVCDTNVMMADADFNIVYMNDSVEQMMHTAEADLKAELPNFNANTLMGSSIDQFHKNPAHQRGMLEALREQYKGQITVGARTFGLIATPIFGDQGARLGTVVEWDDVSEKLEQEQKDKQLAADNTRVKLALDVCSTNVMMADADYNIIYMNESVQKMMKAAEADLREDLPKFDANNLMGNNIDIFHKNPAHQRGMLEKLRSTYETSITVGGRTFYLIANPIFDNEHNRIGTVVEWNDQTEMLAQEAKTKALAEENAAVRLALDVCNTNVMMADADYNINYMNNSVRAMMKTAESDLRQDLPNFDANNLVGNNIDVFHKNPSYQRKMLDSLQESYDAKIKVGPRTFEFTATPIFNADKVRLGTVVEWQDRTAEIALEQEIDSMITAANDGDLSKRIDLAGKEGFFASLSGGLNSLLDKTAAFVGDIGKVFEAMADGNLSQKVDNNYNGELRRIQDNANNSVNKLNEVLSKIQVASETVRTSSQEVAQGSDDLSRRTESQASSLEETASSMEEITAAVKQTSENAEESNALATNAKEKAEKGGEVVKGAVSAMREIMESSNKINDIISVIDEIAFQTNLLALNAAVEAARAGEQGRGFAVVAGEVRTLSQRSAAAAKEIKDLIRDSVNKVESGSALVNQSGDMLNEIVQAVENVAQMINDVNTAATEQNSGISQINQAIAQMDEMTQQNAALVEETSAASRSMSEESVNMNRLISFFRLGGSGASNHSTPSSFAPSNTSYKQDSQGSVETFSAPEPSFTPSEPEPLKTYAPSPANKDAGGAASFSNDDEWEDF